MKKAEGNKIDTSMLSDNSRELLDKKAAIDDLRNKTKSKFDQVRGQNSDESLLAYLEKTTRVKNTVIKNWLDGKQSPFSNFGEIVYRALEEMEKHPNRTNMILSTYQQRTK